ncbi:glycosyltransferase [Streptomyces sp. NPDC001714]|uniref:glycosyltransferase n=1 Tax=Streptomyces sp. NPDC001714 TaxID=3364603 RepID=UPI00367B2D59
MKVLMCPLSDPGFLYPVISVGKELKRRGHEVRLLGRRSAAAPAVLAGVPVTLVEDRHAAAFSASGWVRRQYDQYALILDTLRSFRADVVLTSVFGHGALLAAERSGVPTVVLGLAAYLWPYASGAADEPELPALRRSRLHDMTRLYQDLREQAGLSRGPESEAARSLLGDRYLLRGHPALEYPGSELPDVVRHVGPCFWEPEPDDSVKAQLDGVIARRGKPLVYVHLGRRFQANDIWPHLNSLFAGSPFQAVVELGRSENPAPAPHADLVTVRLPWMRPLVEQASLVLTSATSAPVLGALLHGRPLVVSPAGAEQPLLAEACIRAGLARKLPEPALPEFLEEVAGDARLTDAAQDLSAELRSAAGPHSAADEVEEVTHSGCIHIRTDVAEMRQTTTRRRIAEAKLQNEMHRF